MRLLISVIFCVCIFGANCQQFQPQPLTPGSVPTGTGLTGTGPRPGVFQNPLRTPVGGGIGTPFGPRFGVGSPFGPRFFPPVTPMSMMMASLARNPNNYRYATCTFNDTFSNVKGRADFRQFVIGEGRQQVQVRIQLSGLPMTTQEVERGIHIHEFGDSGDGCARVGTHFNPNQTPHGSQRNFAYLRHVGDLGNIRQSTDGLVSTQFVDQVISLEGLNTVVGRSLVLKLERDDLGMGNNRESQVNGNTYTPIGCCVIGRTTAINWYNPLTAADIQNMAATGLMPEPRIDPYNTAGGATVTGGQPGITGTGIGLPNSLAGGLPGQPGFGGPGVIPGQPGPVIPGQPAVPGQPGLPPQTGFGPQPGFGTPTPGFGAQPGLPARPGVGVQPGFGQPGFGGTPSFGTQPGVTGGTGFAPQPGFTGQPGFGTPGFTAAGGTVNTGGFTQNGAQQGGLTQTGGLTQPGFNPAGQTGGNSAIGTGTFTPGAAPGQTFNFNQQG